VATAAAAAVTQYSTTRTADAVFSTRGQSEGKNRFLRESFSARDFIDKIYHIHYGKKNNGFPTTACTVYTRIGVFCMYIIYNNVSTVMVHRRAGSRENVMRKN